MSNDIRKAGAVALGNALCINSALTTLDVAANTGIGHVGIDAFAAALRENATLTSLNLNANFLSSDGLAALDEALSTNNTLKTLVIIGGIKHRG